MVFGFGKKKKKAEDQPRDTVAQISFQGTLSGASPNLKDNPGLVRAGLAPAKEIISDALSRRAYTIRIDPKGDRAVVMLLVDGMPFPGPRLPKQQALAVTQILKLLAGLNIQERTKPQKGGIKAELKKTGYELIVDVVPVQGGERLTLYADNLNERPGRPEEVGLPDEIRERVRELTKARSGVILTCGPSRSGVTTTAIGVLRSVDAYVSQIYNLADVGSRELPYITNFEWEEGADFETTLGRCQRVEADVIYCPPLTDAEQARVMFGRADKSALLSEYAARDPATGVVQLVKWLGGPELVVEQLKGIFTQKMIRKLCDKCKQAYAPNPKLVAKLGLPAETKAMFRHRVQPQELAKGEEWEPCLKCGDLGYFGRTAMFEFLEMSDGMKEVIAGGGDADAIRAQMKKDGMRTLQQDGLRLVAEGITSLEELQRVFKSGG